MQSCLSDTVAGRVCELHLAMLLPFPVGVGAVGSLFRRSSPVPRLVGRIRRRIDQRHPPVHGPPGRSGRVPRIGGVSPPSAVDSPTMGGPPPPS
eukprot:5075106-Alexandrium_andersonii.AAC.1